MAAALLVVAAFKGRQELPAAPPAHARVDTLMLEQDFDAGVVTVNDTDKSSLFYWYFAPQSGNASAPVILFLQGGPGASGLIGLLFEIGPYQLRPDGQGGFALEPREATWTRDFHVIFVDSPVGTGYSQAGSPEGYSTNEEQVSANLYVFLQRFLAERTHLQRNDFYVVGESYGGHFAPNLAVFIEEQNARIRQTDALTFKGGDVVINLRGLGLQDGFVNPARQVLEKPRAAYYFSLIDDQQLMEAQELAVLSSMFALAGRYEEAYDYRTQMEEVIKQASGVNLLDVRIFGPLDLDGPLSVWANDNATKAALNIPHHVTWKTDPQVAEAIAPDVMVSYAGKVREALDVHGLRVLAMQGQFDLKDGVRANQAWIADLEWAGREEYLSAPYERWYVKDELSKPAGWAQEAGQLTEVVIAGAGHLAPMTQPERSLDCITRWVEGRPFMHPLRRQR